MIQQKNKNIKHNQLLINNLKKKPNKLLKLNKIQKRDYDDGINEDDSEQSNQTNHEEYD